MEGLKNAFKRLMHRPQRLDLDNLKERFEAIGAQLLNIEVNTIVKQGMSAQKMPEAPVALHVIAAAYADFLADLPEDWKAFDDAPPELFDRETRTNDPRTFAALRAAATQALRRAGAEAAADERGPVLVRIRTNSGQIMQQLEALQEPMNKLGAKLIGGTEAEVVDALAALKAPLPIPPDFVVLLRKAWDIGTEIVVFQSTLQIDGDAVTRMSPAIFASEATSGLATESQRAFLSQVHHQALATAAGQWKTLFELLGQFTGALAQTVFPRI